MSGAPVSPERIDEWRCRIPRHGGMHTNGLVFADRRLMRDLEGDQALQQVANVAHLPGIVGPSIAMPDVHWGYGFPIGGVAAFDLEEGVISPGGVGYDINCGVRMLASALPADDARTRLPELMDALFDAVPSGLGSSRSDTSLDNAELDRLLVGGARWAVDRGFGVEADLASLEAGGRLEDADPAAVSARAHHRGRPQLGTLGSGNHFVEIGWVAESFDDRACEALHLEAEAVTVFIHTGSRGLGHQVCDDHLDAMLASSSRYRIQLPDLQLCCAPLSSPEARAYWGAMCAAANFAFANRQVIAHCVRQAFASVFGHTARLETVYDVAHNIAKREEHAVDGRMRTVCVHRKGATRAFPPGHPELHPRYREVGQPVLVPGDMGRCSFVLAAAEGASAETFASCCHGAGRRLSRTAARKAARGRDISGELLSRGVVVRAASRATVVEEMPEAYKDVREVVDVVCGAGLATRVAMVRPMGVVKG